MTAYYKVSGSGNDFLALAAPGEAPAAERIRAWCRRGVSLGADGLFVLRPGGGGVRMDYWNADGLPADLCLNGTRCAARLAFHLGWATERVEIETPAGVFLARAAPGERVAIELPPPEEPRPLAVEAGGATWQGWRLRVGVPHFVLVWPHGLAAAPVAELGQALRRHEVFAPAGTNVNFVRFPTAAAGRHRMEIRTYERGVEAETLSCGTGVLAGTATGLALGTAALPLTVLTAGGFELAVDAVPRERPFAPEARWTLTGDARVVASGEIMPEAATGPAPAAWSAA